MRQADAVDFADQLDVFGTFDAAAYGAHPAGDRCTAQQYGPTAQGHQFTVDATFDAHCAADGDSSARQFAFYGYVASENDDIAPYRAVTIDRVIRADADHVAVDLAGLRPEGLRKQR